MRLASTIELQAGGPGSGCKGPNCGRHGNVTWTKPSDAKRGKLVLVDSNHLYPTQNRFVERQIEDLKNKIQSGQVQSLPALTVTKVKGEPGTYWVWDGHHRWTGAERAGETKFGVWDTGKVGPSSDEGI